MLPEIVPLEMATFTFADDEIPLAGQSGVVMAYVVRHSAGILLIDSGFGFGSALVDDRYHPIAQRLPDALRDAGLGLADVGAVVNCHLHIDHAGQNALFPDIPIYVQPTEWETAHSEEYTILEWIDFPGANYVHRAGDYDLLPGIRVIATPGHTRGHQSLVVETADGTVVLAGQAVYSLDEWAGAPTDREGASRAWNPQAYRQSVERLRALKPRRVHFGHDRQAWVASG